MGIELEYSPRYAISGDNLFRDTELYLTPVITPVITCYHPFILTLSFWACDKFEYYTENKIVINSIIIFYYIIFSDTSHRGVWCVPIFSRFRLVLPELLDFQPTLSATCMSALTCATTLTIAVVWRYSGPLLGSRRRHNRISVIGEQCHQAHG